MIDNRFTLTQHEEYKHLYHLRFSVILPPERYYATETGLVLAVCKQQYPELDFKYQGHYFVVFPDNQNAYCEKQKADITFLEELVFCLPLNLDSIMAGVCSFKKAVPHIQFTVYPAELVDLTPDDFHEIVENMYSGIGLSLRVRAVSWRFERVDSGDPVFIITPTDYDFI